MALKKELIKCPHHERKELCVTRAKYRQGRKLTAVKVYTVNDESPHILVCGVPALGLQDDLQRVSSRFGDIKSLVVVPGYSDEDFTESYHIQFSRVQAARHAKRRLDGLSFYGGVLHVCYAPEMETIAETRAKLVQRRKDVACRVNGRNPNSLPTSRFRSLREMRKIGLGRGIPKPNLKRLYMMDFSLISSSCIWKGQNIVSCSEVGAESGNAVEYGPFLPDGVKLEPVQDSTPQKTLNEGSSTFNWTSKNKFIPRQIAVKKEIVFKKSRSAEDQTDEQSRLQNEFAEDSALIATHSRIEEALKGVSVPNTEINLSKVESVLDMD